MEVPHNIVPSQAADLPGGLPTALLFAESNSRFLVEVPQNCVEHFEETMGDVPHAAMGEVTEAPQLVAADLDPVVDRHLIEMEIDELKDAWQKPLIW